MLFQPVVSDGSRETGDLAVLDVDGHGGRNLRQAGHAHDRTRRHDDEACARIEDEALEIGRASCRERV